MELAQPGRLASAEACRIRHAYCGRLPGDRTAAGLSLLKLLALPPTLAAMDATARRRAEASGVSVPLRAALLGWQSNSESDESDGLPRTAAAAAAAAAAAVIDGAHPAVRLPHLPWALCPECGEGVSPAASGDDPGPVESKPDSIKSCVEHGCTVGESAQATVAAMLGLCCWRRARPSRISARAAVTSARDAEPASLARRPATSADRRATCQAHCDLTVQDCAFSFSFAAC